MTLKDILLNCERIPIRVCRDGQWSSKFLSELTLSELIAILLKWQSEGMIKGEDNRRLEVSDDWEFGKF